MEHLRMSKVAEIPLRNTHQCVTCGRKLRKFVINGRARYITDEGKRHYRHCNMPPNTACTRLETGAASADSESNPAVSSG